MSTFTRLISKPWIEPSVGTVTLLETTRTAVPGIEIPRNLAMSLPFSYELSTPTMGPIHPHFRSGKVTVSRLRLGIFLPLNRVTQSSRLSLVWNLVGGME